MLEREEFLVASHEKVGVSCFRQREQITILGVRRGGSGWKILAK